MKEATFAKDTSLTVAARLAGFVVALVSSIVLARRLGPDGMGVYTLATLFPVFIITVTNLGAGPATVYYVATAKHAQRDIFGTNLIVSMVLGAAAVVIGVALIPLVQPRIFSGVPPSYLLLGLTLVPAALFSQHFINHVLLGARRIKEFNAVSIANQVLFLLCVLSATAALGLGVPGAIGAAVVSTVAVSVVVFFLVRSSVGGPIVRVDLSYLRDALSYGLRAHLANIISFLNYRVELFLLGALVPASAVGLYAVAVGVGETLWLVSQSAGTVLFPTVAAEKDEYRRKAFTPLVSRSVLLLTALGGVALYVVSPWIIVALYSAEYLPTIALFRILLPGIVFHSAARILANDIAGRGRPMLNTCVAAAAVVTQVALNLAWIPRFGAMGAAWATTVAYAATLALRLCLYVKISGNSFAEVILPQRSDVALYGRLASLAWAHVLGWALSQLACRHGGSRRDDGFLSCASEHTTHD